MYQQWSKIKNTFEDRLAAELQGHLQIHVTGYRSRGRGWIIVDGIEVVSIQVPGFIINILGHSSYAELIHGQTVELGRACGEINNLAIDQALSSSNPLIAGLAILDCRCGKRTLSKLTANPPPTTFSLLMLAIRQFSLEEPPMPIRLAQVYLTTAILVDGGYRLRAEDRHPSGGETHRDAYGNAWAHSESGEIK